jgi:hypothetical protein
MHCSTLLGSTLSHPLTRHFSFSPPESLGPLLDGATLTDALSSHRRVPIPMLWCEHGTGMGTVAFATTSAHAYGLWKEGYT